MTSKASIFSSPDPLKLRTASDWYLMDKRHIIPILRERPKPLKTYPEEDLCQDGLYFSTQTLTFYFLHKPRLEEIGAEDVLTLIQRARTHN